MKKKYVIIGITCIFLLISGVFYSCSYQKNSASALLITDQNEVTESDTEKLNDMEKPNDSENLSNTDKLSDTKNQNGANAILGEENTSISMEQKQLIANNAGKDSTEPETFAKPEKLSVHVCGAVKKPGVYEAGEDARVCDLIELAGGLSKNAAGDYINQAQKVTDGQRIYIPTKEEVKDVSPSDYVEHVAQEQQSTQSQQEAHTQQTVQGTAASGVTQITLININSATAEELMELPGIGEAKAAAILDYRSANGSFQSINDLMKISGIKEGLFHKLEKYITVE